MKDKKKRTFLDRRLRYLLMDRRNTIPIGEALANAEKRRMCKI
jgi:hypothetical protein